MDLKRIMLVLFRYKLSISAFVVSSLLVVSAFSFLRAPVYQATAQILVKVGREISSPSQDILDGGGFVIQKRREDIYAEVEILESLFVAEAVVREIGHKIILNGLEPDRPSVGESGPREWIRDLFSPSAPTGPIDERDSFDRAAALIESAVGVEPVIRSDSIRLTYANEEPELAEHLLEVFLAKYLERHIEVHQGGQMASVFEPEVAHYKRALAQAEERIAALNRDRGVFALGAQRAELVREMVSSGADLADTRRDIVTLTRKLGRIEAQLASGASILELPDQSDRNPGLDSLRKTIVGLRLEREEVEQQYTSGSHQVAAILAEISRAEELLADEQARVINTNRKNLADLQTREQARGSEIEGHRQTLEAISAAESERLVLERERDIAERNYLRYVDALEKARISAAMDLARITNVRIIQPAVADRSPKGAGFVVLFAMASILSVLLAVGAAFVFDYLDHSIATSRDIEDLLGLPVLGSIAELRWSKL